MAPTDWNWKLEHDYQDYAWDCSAASIAWCLRTIGLPYSEQDVIAGLGPTRISSTYGLLDATGSGLVSWLGEIGVNAANNPTATWTDVLDAAGFQPMAMGGSNWYHWTAVRMGPAVAPMYLPIALALMNPAPGYMGVDQVMYEADFTRLGPFAAVWFVNW